jgi:homocitrate synthase NifV
MLSPNDTGQWTILDTTLRDGEQTPGVVFDLQDKLAIACLLDKTGIPEAEIGTPAMGEEEVRDMKTIAGQGFGFRTLSWCRANKDDLDMAFKTGTNGVHVSFPVSAMHLKAMGKNEGWVMKSMRELLPYARDHAEYITAGAQDASRTNPEFLAAFVHTALNIGVSRIRIADTVGILNPFSTFRLLESLLRQFPEANFEFHGHNDLGMATANSVAAYAAGAVCIDTTVNGLGERAGNTAMEEFIMAMKHSVGVPIPLNTIFFSELTEYVSKASGLPVPVNKPVTGPAVLCHESGIHTNLLLKNRETYQIISAASVGKKEQEFAYGKHSGFHACKDFLERASLFRSDDHCQLLANKIKQKAVLLRRNLTHSEILHILQTEC